MTINERVSPKKPLFAEVHNVPDDYRFTTEELDRIISGDMFTPRQDAIMARELQQYRAAAEPVYQYQAFTFVENSDGEQEKFWFWSDCDERFYTACKGTKRVLYAAPQVTSDALIQFAEFMAAEAIKSGDYPDGWQCQASNAAHDYAQDFRATMLAAPAVQEEQEVKK